MNWLSYIEGKLSSDKVQGVHWHLGHAAAEIQYVQLIRRKGQIELGEIKSNLSSQELSQYLKNNQPIHLVLTGKGILTKSIASLENRNLTLTLQDEIPIFDPAVFFLQQEKINTGYLISIIRKELLENVYQACPQLRSLVTHVSLDLHQGRLTSAVLGTTILNSFDYSYDFSNSETIGLTKHSSAIANGDFRLPDDTNLAANHLLAFNAALNTFHGQSESLDKSNTSKIRSHIMQRVALKKAAPLLLTFLLLFLIIPLLLQSQLKKDIRQDEKLIFFSTKKLQEVATLEDKLANQDEVLKSSGANKETQVSFYADRLGKTISKNVSLKELEIFPMKGKIKDYEEDELINFSNSKIFIAGTVSKPSEYHEWMNNLKALQWVKEIKHLTFQEQSINEQSFELELFIQIDGK